MAAASLTLSSLLRNVPPEVLQQVVKERHLADLAQMIPGWKELAHRLALSEVEERTIEEENRKSAQRKVAVIRMWRQKNGKRATYKRLMEAFWQMNNVGLVEEVVGLLEGEPDAPQRTGSQRHWQKIVRLFLVCLF